MGSRGDLKTALMLSRFFPPSFAVGGKRAYRFARYLPEFGWRAVVLTDVEPAPAKQDAHARPLPEVHRVCRSWFPEDWARGRPYDSDGTVNEPTREYQTPRSLKWRLRWLVRLPLGRELDLTPRMTQTAVRLAREEDAKVIFATSGPQAALLYGAAAGALAKLPVHLDLRDPWSLNFLQANKSRFTQITERRLEGWLLRRAGRVTFTSESTAEAYRRLYPDIAERISCIYNAYDPADRPEAKATGDGPIRLIHFGSVYGKRRLDTVLQAVARLRDEGGLEPGAIQLENLGRMAERDLALIDDLALGPYVKAEPVVPYGEGLERLATADLQLLVGYGDERLFIPAKLFDYLLSGSPILCVAARSEVTDLVSRLGAGRSVEPGDVEGALAVLREVLAARRQGRRLCEPDEDAVLDFSARETARQLAASFDALSAGR